jgi:ubiquinone/menaquinone biosynthesis C-methylase UbiE
LNYNKIASEYDHFERSAITLWKVGYPEVCNYLGKIKGKTILDYGCGSGVFSRFLHKSGAKVTGVDVSENMIGIAKESKPAGIAYHRITSAKMDFLKEVVFDYVVSNFVLCTLPSRKEIKKVLDEIYRVLKENGLFVFMNSNWDRSNGKEFNSFRMELCEDLRSGKKVMAIIKSNPPIVLNDYFWSVEDYFEMLEQSGFHIRDFSEPLASGNEDHWLDEKNYPPYYIVSAIKT